jgi:hypothetical protein
MIQCSQLSTGGEMGTKFFITVSLSDRRAPDHNTAERKSGLHLGLSTDQTSVQGNVGVTGSRHIPLRAHPTGHYNEVVGFTELWPIPMISVDAAH